MDKYLSVYGWHFSKAMAKFAIDKMFPEQELITPEALEKISRTRKFLKSAQGYDAYFIIALLKSTFPNLAPGQIPDLAEQYFKTCYETSALSRFYADTIANGIPIIWEDML